jgi:hypothetical protein
MIEHLTLLLPQQQLTFPVGLALGALLGGIISGVIIEYYGHKKKVDEERIKVYSRLKGEKFLLSQLFQSTATYDIYIQVNNRLTNDLKTKDDIIKQFDIELRRSFERWVIDLAKSRKRFWKDIGFTDILFDNLNINEIAGTIEITENAIETFMDKLDEETKKDPFQWQNEKLKELDGLIKNHKHSVDELLRAIRSIM